MSRPRDYQLILPSGWYRINPRPGDREPALAGPAGRHVRGVDHAPHRAGRVRDELSQATRDAGGNGRIDLYVWPQAAGLPLSASLVVTLTPLLETRVACVAPELLAESLSGDDAQVTITEMTAGPAVRVRRRIAPGPGDTRAEVAAVTSLDVYVSVPDSGAYLILSFSTSLDHVADALVELFDVIAGTLRWVA